MYTYDKGEHTSLTVPFFLRKYLFSVMESVHEPNGHLRVTLVHVDGVLHHQPDCFSISFCSKNSIMYACNVCVCVRGADLDLDREAVLSKSSPYQNINDPNWYNSSIHITCVICWVNMWHSRGHSLMKHCNVWSRIHIAKWERRNVCKAKFGFKLWLKYDQTVKKHRGKVWYSSLRISGLCSNYNVNERASM